MNDQKMNNRGETKGDINPAIVAGVVTPHEKNKEKIAQTATTVKDDTARYMTKTQKKIKAEQIMLEKRILANKLKVKKVVTSAKNSIDKTTKEVNNAVKSL